MPGPIVTSVCPYARTIAEHYARILWRDIGHKGLMPDVTVAYYEPDPLYSIKFRTQKSHRLGQNSVLEKAESEQC